MTMRHCKPCCAATLPDGCLVSRGNAAESKRLSKMSRKIPYEYSLWFLLILALLVTLLTGCETPTKVTHIPVKPMTPLDGDTTAQPTLKRTAKIMLPKVVRSAPQNAVAPPPAKPKEYVLLWEQTDKGKKFSIPFTNGTMRLVWDVERKQKLSDPWTLFCRTNFNAVKIPDATGFYRVGYHWER